MLITLKKTWKEINQILNRKTKMEHNFQLLINKILTQDKKKIANSFNHYFTNVADELSKKISNTNNKFQDFLKNPNEHSIFFKETTPHEIILIINNLQSTNTNDVYGISTKFVKLGSPALVENLSIIFYKSIQEGTFPDLLKLAKIIPIHKNGSVFTVSNFRPISLLPIFSKIFERLVYDRLICFVKKHNILTPNQYGFQANKSTELAVNEITNCIINSFENKESAFGIFLDFAKAFDTVNHQILISKVEHYGIRGTPLNWFKSYLGNRQQCTDIEGTLSSMSVIKCGVPQGSILGPFLFLIYINDIVNSSSILKFTLFADDTTIFFSSKPSPALQGTFNTELNNVNNWLNCNKLSLNIDKSCYLKFSLLPPSSNITLKMANKPLLKKRVTKYLGVLIDDKLLWKDHIQHINLKIRKGIGMLGKLKEIVTKSTLRTIYFSFVFPYLDYNLLNWSSAYPTNLNCLKISNKKDVRTILSKKGRDHAAPLFKELDILPLDEMIKLKRGTFMWKLDRYLLPQNNSGWFSLSNSVIRNRLNLSKYLIPNPRIQYTKRHNIYSSTKLWNTEIPIQLKQSTSLKIFKKSYKNNLISNL